MSIVVNEIANTQTFGNWFDTTNQIARLFTSNTVTADSTANGSVTSGNVAITGNFTATTVATPSLRGGNVQASANLTVTSNAIFSSSVFLSNNAAISSGSLVSSNTDAKVLDTWARTVFRTAKYVVTIQNNTATGFQATEILLTHNDASSFITEYATLITDSTLGQFSGILQPNNQVQLIFTPSVANSTVKFIRTATTV